MGMDTGTRRVWGVRPIPIPVPVSFPFFPYPPHTRLKPTFVTHSGFKWGGFYSCKWVQVLLSSLASIQHLI